MTSLAERAPGESEGRMNEMKRRTRTVGVLMLSSGRTEAEQGEAIPASPALTDAALSKVTPFLGTGDSAVHDTRGRIVLQMRDRGRRHQVRRMDKMAKEIVRSPLMAGEGSAHVDVGSGWAARDKNGRGADTIHTAQQRAQESLDSRDLMVRSDLSSEGRPSRNRNLTGYQVALSLVLTFVLPFIVMVAGYQAGLDISGAIYWTLVVALGVMVVTQWAEALRALKPPVLPRSTGEPAPRASAIIAAYLPNEADTILETLDAFLAQKYSGGLQVILAYNTPRPLPIEDELRKLAACYPDLVLLKVSGSTSKAQNVNAALARVDGEFVGIFDADHHPMAGAFDRAWRWIASGVDVVQGHCVIRNGADSRVARLVAVEFEQIYAVSHPGRQYLHGFGVFGGSNGFWRTSVLRETRLRTRFLTEDIESSIRLVRSGHRIVNDPGLISRELAPETAQSLWKQRMRWAQGWFQVSTHHVKAVFVDRGLSLNQRFGMLFLLGWREVYPWISSMMWPVLLFFVWRDGHLALSSPIWLVTTLFTVSCGPIQAMFAYKLGVPEIRRNRRWWVVYVISVVLFYQEWKNLIGRVAQIKQLMGERHWAVTPRTSVSLPVVGVAQLVAE
jgi:cellulose synthase/poly-beta-1,6-N-acetylglucosamine synthase-like glycosyltransferase